MRFLKVRDLEKLQHYKDRRPPWIKLYQNILEDYNYTRLQDASKSHLFAIQLLASRTDNLIPYDLEWITRTIHATSPIDIAELVTAGFIDVCDAASNVLADCKQSAMPEREIEVEKETTSRARKKPRLEVVRASWLAPYCAVWEAKHGAGSFETVAGQAAKALAPLVKAKTDPATIATYLRSYLDQTEPKYQSLTKFAQTFAQWAPSDPATWVVDGVMSDEFERMTRPAGYRP